MESNNKRPTLTPEERALRAKKLKRKRTIRLAIVIGGFILAIAILISPILLLTAFRVKSFEVEGVSTYSNEEIIAASGVEVGKSLFFANLKKAGENIERVLPYTDNVKLTKKLPDKIIIRFDETSRAFAIEVSSGMYALTDAEFKVLELTAVLPEDAALLVGVPPVKYDVGEVITFVSDDESDISLDLIKRIASAITENEIKDINYINISNRSDIYMIYQGRIVLRFGDSIDIESKISLGSNVIKEEDLMYPHQYGTADLRIPKKGYFNPSDLEDLELLLQYKAAYENKAPAEETTAEETTQVVSEEE